MASAPVETMTACVLAVRPTTAPAGELGASSSSPGLLAGRAIFAMGGVDGAGVMLGAVAGRVADVDHARAPACACWALSPAGVSRLRGPGGVKAVAGAARAKQFLHGQSWGGVQHWA